MKVLSIAFPVLFFVIGIPLAMRWVPPNHFYGFRTATSFSSPDDWYKINIATGMALIAAGVLGGLVVVALHQGVVSLKPDSRDLVAVCVTVSLMLASLIPVAIYANRF